MKEYLRIVKNPVGMARLVTNYSRIKEMQNNGLTISKMAEIFDEDPNELQTFVDFADGLVSGDKTFSLDVTSKSKRAFETIADALA